MKNTGGTQQIYKITDRPMNKYLICRRILYVMLIILITYLFLTKAISNSNVFIFLVAGLLVMIVTDIFMFKVDYIGKTYIFLGMRLFEFLFSSAVQIIYFDNELILAASVALIIPVSIEFTICYSEFDKSTVISRSIILAIITITKIIFGFTTMDDSKIFIFILMTLIIAVIHFFLAYWMYYTNSRLIYKYNKMRHKLSAIEDANDKLTEYKEKMQTINDKLNFQKIELARTNRELEQANIEGSSHTEIMKYMASTFDVRKCVSVITNTVSRVKKTKLCAIYIQANGENSSETICEIDTNHANVQRYLTSEIHVLYRKFKTSIGEVRILPPELVKEIESIENTNINNVALFPIEDKDKIYGMILVGSDKSDFFDSGLNYYNSCAVELDIAINSANLYNKTQEMARKDGLTGIYNRIYFAELYEKAVKEAIELGTPLSVALFDIDNFKSVNDTYGHISGDIVLKSIASIAFKFANEHQGFVSRYGGEEFVIVFPKTNVKSAHSILECMHEEIKSTIIAVSGADISVNVCIGLSTYPDTCIDTNILVGRADTAMYYGKTNGKGKLVIDNPKI